jgi:hypothetical protein
VKLIDDPRWQDLKAMQELAVDPRTYPMVLHYRNEALAERSSCDPADEAAYDVLVTRFAVALEQQPTGGTA